jgi:hypothetical protein
MQIVALRIEYVVHFKDNKLYLWFQCSLSVNDRDIENVKSKSAPFTCITVKGKLIRLSFKVTMFNRRLRWCKFEDRCKNIIVRSYGVLSKD